MARRPRSDGDTYDLAHGSLALVTTDGAFLLLNPGETLTHVSVSLAAGTPSIYIEIRVDQGPFPIELKGGWARGISNGAEVFTWSGPPLPVTAVSRLSVLAHNQTGSTVTIVWGVTLT